jgi:hypothetical protein
MHLLTVVMHELGHAAGLDHAETGVMEESLNAGTRLAPAVDPLPGHGAPAPVINWQGSAFGAGIESTPQPASQPASWMTDFANYLGKSEAQRNPNSKIKVLVPQAAAKVVSDVARRIGALFG